MFERYKHRSVMLYPYIYVTGGKMSNNVVLADCERYNIITHEWESIASMNVTRHGHMIIEFG